MEEHAAEVHQQMYHAMALLEGYGPVESVIVEGNIAERVAEGLRVGGYNPKVTHRDIAR